MADFSEHARPTFMALLTPDETLRGIAAGAEQKKFGGTLYGVGVTDTRLILQPFDRHMAAKGEPTVVTAEKIASVKLDGAGGGWRTAPNAILDASSVTLELRLTDGQKVKLMMMKGGGGLMGSLGGGASQETGVVALAEWLTRNTAAG